MKNIVLINCENEPIYLQSNLEKNYNLIKFLAIPYLSWMCDFYNRNNNTLHSLITNLDKNITHINKYANTIKVVNNIRKTELSLLHNWRLMLEENILLPDDTIFGESDIHLTANFDWDSIPWDRDYDIYKPFLFIESTSKPMDYNVQKSVWKDFKQILLDVETLPGYSRQKYYWGTHALIIPRNKRHKVIKAFSEHKQPSDAVLLHCAISNLLKIAVLNYNAFSLWPHYSRISFKNNRDAYKLK